MQYRLAVAINPKNPELHKALGMALKERGDVNGAIAELLATTKMMPHDYESELALQSLMQKRHQQ